VFKSKQDKTEYRDLMPEHPRQMLDILAKLDNINDRLDQAAGWAQGIERKLATVIEQWNQSAKANTIGFQWAEDIGRKLDILIEQRSQPVQPVTPMPQVAALNVASDEVTPVAEPDKFDRNGKRKKIFYSTDPVGFIERKIDNATSAYKTSNCIFLSSLLNAVHGKNLQRRPRITAAKLVEHLLELLSENRIIAVRVARPSKVRAGDIGFRISSSKKPLRKGYLVISTEEAADVLGVFEMWNRNG
jgi:hypothetical protein